MESVLHWAYAAQKVHKARRRPAPAGRLRSGMGGAVALGGKVDAGGYEGLSGWGLRFPVHADALAIDELVRGLDHGGLVVLHASAGTRPDWRPAPNFRIEPVRTATGRIQNEETPPRLWMHGQPATWPAGRAPSKWCPVVAVDTPDVIDEARHEYRLWWQSVALLATKLQAEDSLERYEICGVGAPGVPWGG